MKKIISENKKKGKKKCENNFIYLKNDSFKNDFDANIIIDINYITIFIINFLIIINMFKQINNNQIVFKDSKISLKIKGTGEIGIFGNGKFNNFTGIDHLKEVKINGNIQVEIRNKYYFNQTDNFVELTFDDNLNSCEHMFDQCTKMTKINLNYFDTSQITNMNCMFWNCSSLTYLDLSNFNTSKVKNMNCLFSFCSSLTSLDLSNFDISQVSNMNGMFQSCSSLTSLNLSNFIVSNALTIESMFKDCHNLEYINLYSFNEEKLNKNMYIFKEVPINVVICLNENVNEDNIPQIKSLSCHVNYCLNDWKSKKLKIINETNICIESCDNTLQYIYEYNGICIERCPKGFLHDENNNKFNICKCDLEQCLICPKVASNLNLCTKCDTNYYPKESDINNLGEYINCYNDTQEGYYLDITKKLYKKCYNTCKTCNKGGNKLTHNCLECDNNLLFAMKVNNYLNCYENCDYYYYFDNDYNFHCTNNYSCPNEYPKLIKNKKECIKYNIEEIINNLLINNTINKDDISKEEEIKYYDNILKIIENEFTSDNYDTTNIDKGQDNIIKSGKITTTLTTTENQKNNINNNMTRLDLGECETKLRNYYNISVNESIYIKKIDINQDDMNTLKVEYDVYARLFGNNLIKLNLTVCKKNKISILIPIVINENLDKYNSSSGYYNDICYTTTSEDGTDITLIDRQKEYINKDKIICQENCDFLDYDYDTLVAKCSCNIKESSDSFSDMSINKDRLLDNFINIKNFMNFKFLICYKKIFNKNGIINNIGCFILILITLFHIITILIFCIKQFSSLKDKIKKIFNEKKLFKINRFTNKKNYLNKNNNKHFNKMNISHMKTMNYS